MFGGFFGPKQFVCFVAECEGIIEGMALVYRRFSTWKGSILHLEDLIFSQNKRGLGLGTALLDEVVKFGHSLSVKRISWEVLDWNTPAIEFYKKKGNHCYVSLIFIMFRLNFYFFQSSLNMVIIITLRNTKCFLNKSFKSNLTLIFGVN